MSLVGDIAESMLRAAVGKAAQRFVAKGDISQTQAAELVDGVMVEIQLALEMYQASQRSSPAG